MNTKEEKIKSEFVSEKGLDWFDENKDFIDFGSGYFQDRDELYRPKSLQGIENNNGWIRIESEGDLPKEEGIYWVVNGLGKIKYCEFLLNKESLLYRTWTTKFTHYQQIIKPSPPIY